MAEETKAKANVVLAGDLVELRAGLERLGILKLTNFKLNYAVGYNIDKVNRGIKAYFKSLEALKEECVRKNEKGEFVTYAGGIDTKGRPIRKLDFKNPEQKKRFEKEAEKLDTKPFEEMMHKIKVSTLEKEKNGGIDASIMVQIGCILVRDVKVPDTI